MGVGMLDIFTNDPAMIAGPNEGLRRGTWGLGNVDGWFSPDDPVTTLKQNKTDLLKAFDAVAGATGTLTDLKNRAAVYSNHSLADVRSRTQGVLSNLTGLQSNWESLSQAKNDLVARLDRMIANPLPLSASSVGGAPGALDVLSTYVKQKFSSNAQVFASLSAESSNVVSRLNQLARQIGQATSDVGNLSDAAQGKGFSGLLSGVGGAAASTTKTVAIVATIGVLVWALGPSLLGRGFRAARA